MNGTEFLPQTSYIPEPDLVDLWYFKLGIMSDQVSEVMKYQKFKPLGCKDIGIRKFKFVEKNSIPF